MSVGGGDVTVLTDKKGRGHEDVVVEGTLTQLVFFCDSKGDR